MARSPFVRRTCFVVLAMMTAPFRQQIDKEDGMLGVVETRHGRAVHYDVIRVALVAARAFNAIGARAGAYNTVSHCSAPEKLKLRWLGGQGVQSTLFRRLPGIRRGGYYLSMKNLFFQSAIFACLLPGCSKSAR